MNKPWSETSLGRREFVRLLTIGLAGAAAGCAIDPVTGERELVLMSRSDEIDIDLNQSPHQFSADYGVAQDRSLNGYVSDVGQRIAKTSHRPDMPYSFRAVNATYVNAYAFPGGSIACTRGIMLELQDEAELAALLGHEIGHVNARHTAERQTQGMIAGLVVAGLTAYVASENERLAPLAAGLGGIGAGALLATYSRDDEREADRLGVQYMTQAGHNPKGMVGLMNVLRAMNKKKPSAIEMMFSTHPMSEERYQTAVNRVHGEYAEASRSLPRNRERYMDHTASLRAMSNAIEHMQNGDKAMVDREYGKAEDEYRAALKRSPRDYAGLVKMAKCRLAQERFREAERYAERAMSVMPREAQAHHVAGMARLRDKDYDEAYRAFAEYEQLLSGNPNTIFLMGYTQEQMRNYGRASDLYFDYLEMDSQSDQARYAYGKLQEWGYVQPQQQ